MSFARQLAISLSLLLAAGCSPGGGTAAPPLAPAAQQPQSAPRIPAGSSAAQYILGGIDPVRTVQRRDDDRDDDGGWGELRLPVLQSCGNGILASDCGVWSFTNGRGGRSLSSTAPVVLANPPTLNFCRDAGQFPADFGAPAQPVVVPSTSAFLLRYTGTKPAPIVSFATRWWDVVLANTFTGNATTADPILFTPLVTDSAYRGWLVFFTWSWPADILAIPFAVNEIQVAAASSPLRIPAGGSAPLVAFDCLGRPITAAAAGTGFGFNPARTSSRVTSATNALNVPVYGNANPAGFVYLSDDRGALAAAPVAAAASPPPATPPPAGR
ncbi:MAG TPA: hypothetical protein VGC72_02185 [Candidatus Elarobacter sp.]|jgi:hypothetical protein